MNGAEQFANTIDKLEREITALKTNTVKSSSKIATTEKTVNLSFTLSPGGTGNFYFRSTKIAVLELDVADMISQAYVDGMTPQNSEKLFISVRRNLSNKYTVSAGRVETGGSVNCTIRIVGTSDFNFNVRYEDNI